VDGLNINQSNQLGYGIINVYEKHQWQNTVHYRDTYYTVWNYKCKCSVFCNSRVRTYNGLAKIEITWMAIIYKRHLTA